MEAIPRKIDIKTRMHDSTEKKKDKLRSFAARSLTAIVWFLSLEKNLKEKETSLITCNMYLSVASEGTIYERRAKCGLACIRRVPTSTTRVSFVCTRTEWPA